MKLHLLACALGCALLIGCGGDDTPPEGPIKVGLLATIHDPFFASVSNGNRLAVQEVNAAGGVLGRQIELVIADVGESPASAVDGAQQLVDQGVVFILGPDFAETAFAAAEYLYPKEIPLISMAGGITISWPQIQPAGDRYAFSLSMPEDRVLRAAISATAVDPGMCSSLAIVVEDRPDAADGLAAMMDELTTTSITLTSAMMVQADRASHATTVAALIPMAPDCVLLDMNATPSGVFIKEWNEMAGPAVKWIRPRPPLLPQLIGSTGDPALVTGLIGAQPISNDPSSAQFQEFQDAFVTTYGEEPTLPFAPFMYDETALALLSIQAAGSTAGADVRNALLRVSGNNGGGTAEPPYGPTQLDEALVWITESAGDFDYEGASSSCNMTEGGFVVQKIEVYTVTDAAMGTVMRNRVVTPPM